MSYGQNVGLMPRKPSLRKTFSYKRGTFTGSESARYLDERLFLSNDPQLCYCVAHIIEAWRELLQKIDAIDEHKFRHYVRVLSYGEIKSRVPHLDLDVEIERDLYSLLATMHRQSAHHYGDAA